MPRKTSSQNDLSDHNPKFGDEQKTLRKLLKFLFVLSNFVYRYIIVFRVPVMLITGSINFM